jgi:uncharacterized protein YlxP (DUF503 family)
MRVAVLHVELFIPYALSLKDKRMVLRRVKDRLGKFNVAVAEVEHQDLWQRARLAVVGVNTDHSHLETTLQHIAGEAGNARDVLLVDSQVEYL